MNKPTEPISTTDEAVMSKPTKPISDDRQLRITPVMPWLPTKRVREMKTMLFAVAAVGVALVSITLTMAVRVAKAQKEIAGIAPQDVRWFTPSYYSDGRQRAQMFGDSNQGDPWIDRVKIPAGVRVLAHRHPQDEIVTVIEGTWYLGAGEKFDPAKLKPYPAGSFIVIPAGVPHFVAAKDSTVIVQVSGTGKFATDYLESQNRER